MANGTVSSTILLRFVGRSPASVRIEARSNTWTSAATCRHPRRPRAFGADGTKVQGQAGIQCIKDFNVPNAFLDLTMTTTLCLAFCCLLLRVTVVFSKAWKRIQDIKRNCFDKTISKIFKRYDIYETKPFQNVFQVFHCDWKFQDAFKCLNLNNDPVESIHHQLILKPQSAVF